MVYLEKRSQFSHLLSILGNFRKMIENRREAMKAKHALYLGLIIIGAAFLVVGSTVLGLIFEGVGLVLLLISALLEWAGEHQDPHP